MNVDKMIKKILVLIGFLFMILAIQEINAEICECNSCEDCTKKLNDASCTEVYLSKNISAERGCISSKGISNKILDCKGHIIDATFHAPGIYLNNLINVTVTNCVLNSSNIYLYNSHYCVIKNNTIYGYIDVYGSSNNKIKYNYILNSDGEGITIQGSSKNFISDNKIHNHSGYGVHIGVEPEWRGGGYLSTENILFNNEITMNQVGILVRPDTNNTVIDSNKICWNLEGDIIVKSNYSIVNLKDNICGDSKKCKKCDEQILNCNCSSCIECKIKLIDPRCKEVTLISNITQYVSAFRQCISFNGSNKIFNCDMHSIIQSDVHRGGTGIVYNNKNNTIMNCIVKNFSDGIVIEGDNCKLINNIIENNRYGIMVSGNGFIINNTILSNSHGIEIEGNATILNNKILSSEEEGIHLARSTSVISKNFITNSIVGINSTLSNIEMNSNVVCNNKEIDLYSENWQNSTGVNNTCDNPDGWDDEEKEGCTYKCGEQKLTEKPSKLPEKPPYQEPNYNNYIIITIILITILLTVFVIWYKKFKK